MKKLLYSSLCYAVLTLMPLMAEDAKCPVSGKPVDKNVASNVNGKSVAFCCGKCKAKFVKDLNVEDAGPGKCQYSGEAADKDTQMLHSVTTAVYLCCGKCEKKYAASHKVAAIKDEGPAKCQYSGKAADKDSFVVDQGKKIYFCCDKCAAKYKKEKNVVMIDKGPGTCPISGEKAEAANVLYETKTKAVYFCCEKCSAKYVANEIAAKL